MRTVLLDADVLVYEAATANEVPTHWGDDLWTLHADLKPAIIQLDAQVAEIRENTEADAVVMCLSDYDKPWRREILPTYKANRKATRKPVIYEPLRKYVHENYQTFQRPGLEGDDCLGILLTNPVVVKGEKIVVSIDKDMNTLPGMHLNLKKARDKGAWFPYTVTKSAADYFHMKQTLMGDTTDGYSGCPGMGPVSAEKLLIPFVIDEPGYDSFDAAGAWAAIVAAYEKKGLTEDDALVMARVARICRHSDYDYTNKQVKLWNPPK